MNYYASDLLPLFKGTLIDRLIENDTFLQVNSPFNEYWYNQVIPTTSISELDIDSLKHLIALEKNRGRFYSLYVENDDSLRNDIILSKHGFALEAIDVLVGSVSITDQHYTEFDFRDVDESLLTIWQEMSAVCFPEWKNNDSYVRACYRWSLRTQTNDESENLNVLVYKDGTAVAFGSMLYSQSLSTAYLHNLGTLPKYRRQGLFRTTVNHLCIRSYQLGIRTVYSLVAPDQPSFWGLQRLGFSEYNRYQLYVPTQ